MIPSAIFACCVILAATSLCRSALASDCRTAIGIEPAQAQGSVGLIFDGCGQTFTALDTLVASLTLWRVASQDSSWLIGLRPWFMMTDSTGKPDTRHLLYEGTALVIPDGDGVNPIEFRWDFDPPVSLPGPGKYAFFVFRDPCFAYIDLISKRSEGGSAYPGGEYWSTHRTFACVPYKYMNSIPDVDLGFKIEFCSDQTTPVSRSTWGGVKARYRPMPIE